MTNPIFERLRARLAEIYDLRSATALLYWDQQTIMPRAGAAARAEQLATLSRMTHELFVADETGKLLEELRAYEDSLDPDSFEASLIRVTRRDYEKSVRVPADLRAEMSRAGVARDAGVGAGEGGVGLRRASCPRSSGTSTCGSSTSTASTRATSRTTCSSTTTRRG